MSSFGFFSGLLERLRDRLGLGLRLRFSPITCPQMHFRISGLLGRLLFRVGLFDWLRFLPGLFDLLRFCTGLLDRARLCPGLFDRLRFRPGLLDLLLFRPGLLDVLRFRRGLLERLIVLPVLLLYLPHFLQGL